MKPPRASIAGLSVDLPHHLEVELGGVEAVQQRLREVERQREEEERKLREMERHRMEEERKLRELEEERRRREMERQRVEEEEEERRRETDNKNKTKKNKRIKVQRELHCNTLFILFYLFTSHVLLFTKCFCLFVCLLYLIFFIIICCSAGHFIKIKFIFI